MKTSYQIELIKSPNTCWRVLKAVVCQLVGVRSRQGLGRCVAGNQCSRVTDCAEALQSSEKGEQNRSPQHQVNPAASGFWSRGRIGRAKLVSESEGRLSIDRLEGMKNLESNAEELSGVGGAGCGKRR